MDRLFFSFQLRLLLALLAAGLVGKAVIVPRIDKRIASNIEDVMAPPLAVLAEMLSQEQASTPGPSRTLERARKHFGAPLMIVPRQSLALSTELLGRLDRGDVVCESGRVDRAIFFVQIGGTEQVVRLGPLTGSPPFGQGRGLQVILLGLGGLTLGVYLLVRPLRRRLTELSQAAESFGRGALAVRAPVRSRDAIGGLALAFNRMAEQIQRLIAAQHELLRMVSHELRTPLQRIHFAAEIIRSAEDAERRDKGLLRMERDLKELDELIDELLTYVRLQHEVPLNREAVDLHQAIDEVIATQAELAGPVSLTAVAARAPLPAAQVDPRLLRRALANLIGNALCHAGSRVEVTVAQSGQTVQFKVDDDGPGVPLAERERIFAPFHRLAEGQRRRHAGCGLGLAIVRRIADRHHGRIEVMSSRLGGACFLLSLPALDPD